jgi:PAS domain S-box-containing protein
MIATPTSRHSFVRALRVARFAALVTGILGAVALTGWALGFSGLASPLEVFGTLHPNAAAALVAGALAAELLQQSRPRVLQALGAWVAAAVAALGLVTVGQDALGYATGIDRLLWPARLEASLADLPQRMPPMVSLALLALGVALVLTRSRSRRAHAWSEWLALAVFAAAVVVLVGHLFRVEAVASLGGATPVGAAAAAACAWFAVATLFTSPALGIARRFTEDTAGGLALRRLLPAALIVPVLIGLGTQRLTHGSSGDDAVLAGFSVAVALLFTAIVLRTDAAMRTIETRRSEAEMRFRRTFENATVGIAHVAPDGRWLRVNERLCELVGRPRAELEELVLADLLHPQDREQHAERESRLRRGEISSARGVERLIDSDGSTVWVDVRASPQLDEAGELEYLIYVLLDVTERVQVQAERERLYQEALESRAEAERANRAKDEFFALISHELRAPLNTMTSWLSVLQGANDAELRAQALRTIQHAVRGQARLINDLLDASRIQSGKLELANELFDARAAVGTTIDSVLPAASAKGVRLVKRLGSESLVVRGDQERFEQVARNLLDNALKFTPTGGHIEVALRRQDDRLVLEVRDDGAGIDAEALPQVFERFHQGRGGGGHGGLGLGLSIVKHVIEQHGGTVTAESPGQGRGTTVRATLPLADEPLPPSSASSPRHRPDTAGPDLDIDVLLVVEDDAAALEAVCVLLATSARKVLGARSGAEALRVASDEPPDLLITDYRLPDMTGAELVGLLEAQAGREVPALALTGHSRAELGADAAAFTRVLRKPVTIAELEAALKLAT